MIETGVFIPTEDYVAIAIRLVDGHTKVHQVNEENAKRHPK
jgi:hypothetical protein